MHYTLTLGDIIDKTEIEHNNIAVIRHSRNHPVVKQIWQIGMSYFEEYQKIQPFDYFHKKEYIFSFVNDAGTNARFIGVYKVRDVKPLIENYVSEDYWIKFGFHHNLSKDSYFDLEKLNILEDLQDRLVVDFGGTTNIVHVNWNTISSKPIISISSNAFEGYENIIWKYSDLEKYIGHEDIYQDIHLALSKVNGVYLIIDTVNYSQYIGSAYGNEGIWGRWKEYLKTKGSGGNKKMMEHLDGFSGSYRNLQFTILEVIPRTGNKSGDKNYVLEREAWYKKKLLTRNSENGLNMN